MQRNYLICGVLLILTLVVYAKVICYEFVAYDDDSYVYGNPHVYTGLTADNIIWAFTKSHVANWHSLTWVSLMIDAQITRWIGNDPTEHNHAHVFHATNLLLHVANVLLVFAVLNLMTHAPWRCACVAAIFAVHPIHIESVAWVAERKDVLSILFWWLAVGAYVRYTTHRSYAWYALVAVFLVMGLLAKPMLVTLPFALLLLDVWPLNRLKLPGIHIQPDTTHSTTTTWTRAVIEKLPLLLIAGAAIALTIHVQKHAGATTGISSESSIGMRLANAATAYAKYLGKLFWPFELAAFYPHLAYTGNRTIAPLSLAFVVAILALASTIITWLTWRLRRGYLLIGWLRFVGTMVPVIGIIQVGGQAMADRYAYVPFIGLYVLLVWVVAALLDRVGAPRAVGAGIVIVVLALLAWRSSDQLLHWQSSIDLFKHTNKVTENNWRAHFGLATTFYDQGIRAKDAHERTVLLEQSVDHARAAVDIAPTHYPALRHEGMALWQLGHYDTAILRLQQARATRPDDQFTIEVLVQMCFDLNRYTDAIEAAGSVDEAVRIIEATLPQDASPADVAAYKRDLERLMSSGRFSP